MTINEVIVPNLVKMFSTAFDGAEKFFVKDAVLPCVITNFYFDKDEGEINRFCYLKKIPSKIIGDYQQGQFLIGWNQEKNERTIFSVGIRGDTTEKAKNLLLLSAELYNERGTGDSYKKVGYFTFG